MITTTDAPPWLRRLDQATTWARNMLRPHTAVIIDTETTDLPGAISREDIVLATKLFSRMHDGPGGSGLIDASLRRLNVDYIDLYQIHRFDPDTPVEETMRALHDLVKAGKVRYLGASSMWAWRFATMQHAAETHGWTKYVSMQDQYSQVRSLEEPYAPRLPTYF